MPPFGVAFLTVFNLFHHTNTHRVTQSFRGEMGLSDTHVLAVISMSCE